MLFLGGTYSIQTTDDNSALLSFYVQTLFDLSHIYLCGTYKKLFLKADSTLIKIDSTRNVLLHEQVYSESNNCDLGTKQHYQIQKSIYLIQLQVISLDLFFIWILA